MGKAANDMRAIYKKVRDAAMTATLNASDDIQSTSRDTVREWRNKPEFGETVYNGLDRIEVTVKPKGNKKVTKIFNYVDKGTKGPYLILPKVAGTYLKFRANYSARTAPVARYNLGSGRSFGQWVSKASVVHPGIKAREFMVTAMDKMIPSFQVRIQQEINKAVA